MKKCVKCGFENEDDNKFCEDCGSEKFIKNQDKTGLSIGANSAVSAHDIVGGNKETIHGKKEVVSGNKEEINAQTVNKTVNHVNQTVIHQQPQANSQLDPELMEIEKRKRILEAKKLEVEIAKLENENSITRNSNVQHNRVDPTPKAYAPIYAPMPPQADKGKNRILLWIGGGIVASLLLFFMFKGVDDKKESVSQSGVEVVQETAVKETAVKETAVKETAVNSKNNVSPTKDRTQKTTAPQKNQEDFDQQPVRKTQQSQPSQPQVQQTTQVASSQVAAEVTVAKSADDYYKEGLSAYRKFNYSQAISSFQKAAESGNAGALYYIGMMYLDGNGIEKNADNAFLFIQKAAKAGHKDAIYQLAQMYDGGLGTEKDKSQARMWYQKAADMGNAAAKRRLESI